MKVAIIGAGASGIAASRALQQKAIDFVCFEKGSKVGGLWRFKNDNGLSSAYRSLHINTSKRKMEFDDFPMPDDYPDFPHHEQIADYFEQYIDHFDLAQHIRFNTTVESIDGSNEGWQVTHSGGQREQFSHVIVANGHHWDPRWPEPKTPGVFDGVEMHAHYFIDPDEPHSLRDKNVVVVGMGNSAMDIACELSRKGVARQVWLSSRSGVHVMPKYFGANVLDYLLRHPAAPPDIIERIAHLFPRKLRIWLFNTVLERKIRTIVGRPEDFGLPKPQHKFHKNHPTISNEIHARLGSGDLLPKPALKHFYNDRVEFVDGSKEQVDAIIYCTGYNIRFPFLAAEIVDPKDNEVMLYQRIFSPEHPGLFFVGLVQPLCALMPIAQVQSRLVAALLCDDYQLPSKQQMQQQMEREYRFMRRNYTPSARHTIQIDCLEYSWQIRQELKKGARRFA